MSISMHLILAIGLATTLLLLVLGETTLRRRLQHFRVLQLFVVFSGLLLIPANVIAALAPEPTSIHVALITAAWAVLISQVVLFFLFRLSTKPNPHPRRVLAVGAHPDDLELACGGTLARLADAGHEIQAIVMSDGAVGGDAAVRPTEASTAASFLSLAGCQVLGLPDTKLEEQSAAMMQAIERAIKSLNPDLVLTHSANDQHQDHVAVHWATLRAARQHPAILCFESPSVTPAFTPQVFVDIDDYVGVKAEAVALHNDQNDKPYMRPEALAAMATYRGRQGKLPAAEGFEAVRINGFSGVL